MHDYDGRYAEFMSKLNEEFDIKAQRAPAIVKKVKSVVQVPSVVQIAPSQQRQYSLGKRKRSAFEKAKDNIADKRPRLDSVLGEQTSSGTESPHSDPDDQVKKKISSKHVMELVRAVGKKLKLYQLLHKD